MPKMPFAQIINFSKRFFRRNFMILNNSKRCTFNNTVNLHWWKPISETEENNLGDYLAVPIFNYLLKYYGIKDNKCKGRKHLYTVGSIIFMGLQDATIWGSGLLYEDKLPFIVTNRFFRPFKVKLDIRAVRGPRTKMVLDKFGYNCPDIYGDPAILMPLIYNPKADKEFEYTVVHHMYSHNSQNEKNEISIQTSDYEKFIDRIVKSKKVISGSLHGIILAEAYGVPAVLLMDRPKMDMFKYKDYYEGTGRFEFPLADSLEEAIEMSVSEPPDFSDFQQKMIEAFPKDLWQNNEEMKEVEY